MKRIVQIALFSVAIASGAACAGDGGEAKARKEFEIRSACAMQTGKYSEARCQRAYREAHESLMAKMDEEWNRLTPEERERRKAAIAAYFGEDFDKSN